MQLLIFHKVMFTIANFVAVWNNNNKKQQLTTATKAQQKEKQCDREKKKTILKTP